ncbi:MAG: thioredoxin reductase [Thermoprotei archaeon]|nr:MAG: thioredoxin reductase [Thermoprotei archaeon]
MEYDVVIIGGGIAGLTASLYLARLKVDTLLISIDLGGQLNNAVKLHNYPGFDGEKGIELVRRIVELVQELGIEILIDEVILLEKVNGKFYVTTRSGEKFTSKVLILAMGKVPIRLAVPGEEKFRGRGVSYCILCDAPITIGRKVAMVSYGHRVLGYLEILRKYASEIYLVSPKPNAGLSREELEHIISQGIHVVDRAKIKKLEGRNRLESIILEREGLEIQLKVDMLFVELGYTTATDILRDFVKLNERGEVIIDKYCQTSVEGVFAAGDITDIPYKQAIVAAGQGAIAALSAYRYLKSRDMQTS